MSSILISLGVGAETLDMRVGAEATMTDIHHITNEYELLRDRTGIKIEEYEAKSTEILANM